jgi:hypothetical protein
MQTATKEADVARYSIVAEGMRRRQGVRASEKLTRNDFDDIARDLGLQARAYWKNAPVSARQVTAEQKVVTKWEGELTENTAKPGAWIATNLDPHGRVLRDRKGNPNQYVIQDVRFAELYEKTIGETEYGAIYCPKTNVDALDIPGSLDIIAPWGERQTLKTAYLLRNGDEVYGITRPTFKKTYEPVER